MISRVEVKTWMFRHVFCLMVAGNLLDTGRSGESDAFVRNSRCLVPMFWELGVVGSFCWRDGSTARHRGSPLFVWDLWTRRGPKGVRRCAIWQGAVEGTWRCPRATKIKLWLSSAHCAKPRAGLRWWQSGCAEVFAVSACSSPRSGTTVLQLGVQKPSQQNVVRWFHGLGIHKISTHRLEWMSEKPHPSTSAEDSQLSTWIWGASLSDQFCKVAGVTGAGSITDPGFSTAVA